MAVTQISRIQHRRGLHQDLPQLASAELGWSLDQRRLFIGNGTLEEGAPTTGVTEILTEYSDLNQLFSVLNAYSFYGNAAGYSAQTGASILNPTTRSYQAKLDDIVNVRDFGAIGNGITDDTAAINRALQEIYKTAYNESNPLARRTIYFPGGTYLISSELLIPPYARLIGDGISSSIIKQINGNKSIIILSDSKFQIGANLGNNSAILPRDIEIASIQFFNSNISLLENVVTINSANNVRIQNASFIGNSSAGNLVGINGSVSESNNITFDSCKFLVAGNALCIDDTLISHVKVLNNSFDYISNTAINLGSVNSMAVVNNYFGNIGINLSRQNFAYNSVYSIGNYFYSNNSLNSGLYLGNLQITNSYTVTLDTNESVISLISNAEAIIDYSIVNDSARRIGTITVTNYNLSNTTYTDEYTETDISANATITTNTNSIIASVSSGTALMQFNVKRYR